jgi:hypothetical protein
MELMHSRDQVAKSDYPSDVGGMLTRKLRKIFWKITWQVQNKMDRTVGRVS